MKAISPIRSRLRRRCSFLAVNLGAIVLAGIRSVVAQGSPDLVWQGQHAGYVRYTTFSPDGQQLASGGDDRKNILWRASDGTQQRSITQCSGVGCRGSTFGFYSPDGQQLATAGIKYWRVADGTLARTLSIGGMVAFSPDWQFIASSIATSSYPSQTRSIALFRSDGSQVWKNSSAGGGATVFSPDGHLIASIGFAGIDLIRPADGSVVRTIVGPRGANMVFSHDGQFLATNGGGGGLFQWDDTIKIYRVSDGTLVRTLSGTGVVTSIIFTPDDQMLINSSWDSNQDAVNGYLPSTGSIRFWRVSDGALLKTYDQNTGTSANALSVSPDGKLFGYSHDSTVVVARVPSLSCSFSISPAGANLPTNGGSGSINISAPSGCSWSAVSRVSWIALTGATDGDGNGTVTFTAEEGSSGLTGLIIVAEQTFVVRLGADPCTFTVNPTSSSWSADGGTAAIGVQTPSGCGWTAQSNDDWITITKISRDNGGGGVTYSVAPGNLSRTGTLTVAGQTVTVQQDINACRYTLSPTNQSIGSEGGPGNFSVTTASDCSWTASSNATWVTITLGGSGSGNGTVEYAVIENKSGLSRTATISVADKVFSVVQGSTPGSSPTPTASVTVTPTATATATPENSPIPTATATATAAPPSPTPTATATDGALDPTFGIGGKVVTDFNNSTDWLSRIAIQPDGKIVAIGVTHPSHRGALARYNPDGSLDATFGNGGKVITVATVRENAAGLLILPDGKIMISGSIDLPNSSDTSFVLLRFNSDGSADPTFGNGGMVTTNVGTDDDTAYALARQSDGKIVAAGRRGIQFYPTEQRKGNVALARYNPDGSLDTSFGAGGKVVNDFGQGLESYALEVIIQPDGKIIVAGESSYEFLVARYNSNGAPDAAFGNGGFTLINFSSNWDHGRDAVLQADGKIILVGIAEMNYYAPYDSFAVARVNPDGSLDQSFGNAGKFVMADRGDLEAAVLQSDGKLIALGTSGEDFELLRFNLNGSLDSTFGNGGIVTTTFGGSAADGSDLVFQPDGKLLAAGLTSTDIYFQNSDFALARYLDGSAPPPTPTPTPTGTPTATATATATATPNVTPSATPGFSPTPTATSTPAATPPVKATPTAPPVVSPTPSTTPTFTPSSTPQSSPTSSARATATATPGPTRIPKPLNIATRGRVGAGDNAMIGGFIISGDMPRKVVVRAIGPSLQNMMPGAISDPVLQLRAADGLLVRESDNWKEDPAQAVEIEASGVAPRNDFESALVVTLAPGNYTAAVTGKNGAAGVGLVEVYDVSESPGSQLANLSTRGAVQSAENVMIGGFILGGGDGASHVLIRALGPSLTDAGVRNALANPTLELHDENGALLSKNDNWKDQQQTAIEQTGIPPGNDSDSAILADLVPGAYTAVVAGKDETTGIALIELYHLR
jgi:uncharacterized delta-60 repeat protein